MNMNHSAPASPSIVRPRCSGSSNTLGRPSGVPNPVHVRPTSWYSQALFLVSLVALVAFPATVSAAPPTLRSPVKFGIDGMHQRRQNSGSQNNNNNNNDNSTSDSGSVSISVWLPILFVTIMFVIFSFVVCLRRRAAMDAVTATASANRAASTPGSGNATRPRRRPRRTPSQISTKSLPPYMKEPGDHELVLYRGPSDTEDDEHPDMHDTTFDIALDRIESVDTMADSSSTNLLRRVSVSVTRPPEVHHATASHEHHRSTDAHSLDSVGSEAELLSGHRRGISVDTRAEPRGEAPAYTEAAATTTIISLNDPGPNTVSSNVAVTPSSAASGGHSRFSFLRHNPFGSHDHTSGTSTNANQSPASIRSESPGLHVRSGSALSRFSSHESHESHHSRPPSRNNLSRTHSRSNSNLFRAFRSHSPVLHAGSSTISLDSISAPLTHTLKRAEFHAPKGGLLTPEQVKLITSKQAVEKFGMPYGPDAVAAFSLSRDRLAETVPPPDFETVVGEHQEQLGTSGSGTSATEVAAQGTDTADSGLGAASSHSTSLSPASQLSLSHGSDVSADSQASTAMSYATAPDSEGDHSQVQTVRVHTSEDERTDEPDTARPTSPRTARPLSLSGDHGSVARRL